MMKEPGKKFVSILLSLWKSCGANLCEHNKQDINFLNPNIPITDAKYKQKNTIFV